MSLQRFTFDSLEGVDLGALPAVFTHDDAQLGGGRIDVVSTTNQIDLDVSQFTASVSLGLSDRLDVAAALPIVDVRLGVTSRATIQRFGTAASPATHFFATAEGGFGTERTFTRSGSASGIGDLTVRLKLRAVRRTSLGVAVGVDGRLPTGDEEDLLGSGAPGLKPFLVASYSNQVVSPHASVAYQWNGSSVLAGNVLTGEKRSLPDQILYAAGVDVGVTPRLTLAADLIGRHVLDSPRLVAETFHAQNGATLDNIRFLTGQSFDVLDGSLGAKLNVAGRLLVDANVLLELNDAGLRDKVTVLGGSSTASDPVGVAR